MITAQKVKELREQTGVGLMDCKAALKEANGDMEKATEILRLKGLAGLEKRSGREVKEGIIESYIHSNQKIGVLVEINCETDFVARNEKFKEFAHDIALQIAAAAPMWVNVEDVPEDVLEKERRILKEQAIADGKPENIAEKMVEGRIKKFYSEFVLLNQPFIKDSGLTVLDFLGSFAGSIGENIKISRFIRMELGKID